MKKGKQIKMILSTSATLALMLLITVTTVLAWFAITDRNQAGGLLEIGGGEFDGSLKLFYCETPYYEEHDELVTESAEVIWKQVVTSEIELKYMIPGGKYLFKLEIESNELRNRSINAFVSEHSSGFSEEVLKATEEVEDETIEKLYVQRIGVNESLYSEYINSNYYTIEENRFFPLYKIEDVMRLRIISTNNVVEETRSEERKGIFVNSILQSEVLEAGGMLSTIFYIHFDEVASIDNEDENSNRYQYQKFNIESIRIIFEGGNE